MLWRFDRCVRKISAWIALSAAPPGELALNATLPASSTAVEVRTQERVAGGGGGASCGQFSTRTYRKPEYAKEGRKDSLLPAGTPRVTYVKV